MRIVRVSLLALLFVLVACTIEGEKLTGLSSFHVVVTQVNAGGLPTSAQPFAANRGEKVDAWAFTIEARTPTGKLADWSGMVRLSVRPGTVVSVEGDGSNGRNIAVLHGKAVGVANVTATYGPSVLWVTDLGYEPGPAGRKPACSNGKDDDGDKLVDFPTDPGCAFADDDSEEEGSSATGVAAPVHYALPTIADVQGYGAKSPYPNEGMQLNTDEPQHVVVTRVASTGFYATDVSGQANGYNNIYAFNFAVPPGMQVCDHITYLAGTVNEFFGFTELSFPSWRLEYVYKEEDCLVPEPTELDAALIASDGDLEKLESGLVRASGFTVPSKFGPGLVQNNVPTADASNCDLNGDGQVDYMGGPEADCQTACDMDPMCTEYTSYSARGNYKISSGGTMILLNTDTVTGFDPRAHRGETLAAVTGTLRNFSGGTFKWTIETRCSDDLACSTTGCGPMAPLSSKKACVRLRNIDDNDQGTN
jgi:hypothetical protein